MGTCSWASFALSGSATPRVGGERLEYLREFELRAELDQSISNSTNSSSRGGLHPEGCEHIEPGDVELLEAAGVPEFEESED
jgi:hypothetical protein